MLFAYAKNAGSLKADLLVVPAFEGANPLKGYDYEAVLSKQFVKGDFEGKSGKTLLIASGGAVSAKRVLLVGCGKAKDASAQSFGETLAGFFRGGSVKELSIAHVGIDATQLADSKKIDDKNLGRWIAEGSELGSYRFDRHHTNKDKKGASAKKISIVGGGAGLKAGVSYGAVTAEYTAHCRDLVNEPSNKINPATLAKFAQDMAKKIPGLTCKILKKAEITKLKMGAFLAVNEGSDIPANLIILEWNGGKKGEKPIAFVGKGLTFDSGGYDLKPAAGMLGMKMDMGGGAATIAALGAIAKVKVKKNVVGIVPATENLVNAAAFHPGSVQTSMSGQTIEIGNTDAEGRLILCDALTYAQKTFKPRVIVDMATLTGAQLVAVGAKIVAVMSNDDKVAKALDESFKAVGEDSWRLPLPACYDKQLDSTIADMKNIGANPGCITAGLFLQRFIDDGQAWAHLDIAGPCMNDAEPFKLWNGKSATGSPVRSLVEFAENF